MYRLPPTVKARNRGFLQGLQNTYSARYFNGTLVNVIQNTHNTVVGHGRQVTTSQGHQWPPKRRHADEDVGGNFTTDFTYISDDKGNIRTEDFDRIFAKANEPTPTGTSFLSTYDGCYLPFSPSQVLTTYKPPDLSSSDQALDTVGTTAIARCKPDNPVSDLSVALGELLKDGLPSLLGAQLWRDRASRLKSAGGEYLNVEFGWLPLLSDIKKVSGAVSNSDALLKQYIRNSGRRVRRQYSFDTKTERTTSVVNTNSPVFGPTQTYMSTGFGTLERHRVVTRDQWFSGCFTYYLDEDVKDDKWARAAVYADYILGARLDLEVLWNLAPWSWAVDWMVNFGDVISNIDSFAIDGLIMPYAYVMETTKVTDTYITHGLRYKRRPNVSVYRPAVLSVTRVIKKRRKATPYGFGLTWDGLSPRQIAIAAALGLSRSSR